MNQKYQDDTLLSLKNFDIFGIKFNFLFKGKEVYRTHTGAFLTLLYTVLVLGLFFFFALDLIQRKNPRVSFNSSKEPYQKVKVSNENFTYAFRVENQNGSMLLDDSLIYLKAAHLHYEIIDNKWSLVKETSLDIQRCSKIPNYEEKQKYYDISLDMWYCIDFDGITMGGNWDGNFVNALYVNALQCVNGTEGRTCATQSYMENNFISPVSGSNFFFSDLSAELQPMMNNYEKPLGSLLINRYEMLHMEYTKRKIITYKTTSIDNDKGWFFPDVQKEQLITTDTNTPDFTFKNKWGQNVLYNCMIYLGNKQDNYIRSYTKIQEVLAAIGGFAKVFHSLILFVYLFIGKIYKNIALSERFKFNEELFDLNKYEIKNASQVIINKSSRPFEMNRKDVPDSQTIQKKTINNISAFDYFCYKFCKKRIALKTHRLSFEKMECYEKYFNSRMDVVKYIKMLHDFKILKKVLLTDDNKKMLKEVRPQLKSNISSIPNNFKIDSSLNISKLNVQSTENIQKKLSTLADKKNIATRLAAE